MKRISTRLAALAALTGTFAAAHAAEKEAPFVTGALSLAANTHFISYGADVWAAGTKWDDILFNPQIELSLAFSDTVTGFVGTWWDVNDNADSNIGDAIQEVDVWAGVAVATGDLKTTLTYQEWMYASQSERIVDLKFALSHPLNPSLMVHGRVDGEGMDTGVATVLGIAPGTSAGKASLSFPISVAADTDGFHGGDAGFSFASIGASATLPLDLKGGPSLGAGVTGYYTNDDVIPNNPEETFVTGTVSFTLPF